MKKKEILIISITIIVLLLLVFGIIVFTKDTTSPPDTEEDEKIAEQEQEFISCLENELGARIASERIEFFTDIPLSDITDKKEEIVYFKGVQNGNDSYIIVKTNAAYDRDIMQDFDLYFSKKYDTFQLFDLGNDIYVYLFNNLNDTFRSDLLTACRVQNFEGLEIKDLPDTTIDELNKTDKIIIKNGSSKLGEITNADKINQVLNYILMSKQYGETFLCDAHQFEFEMLDEKGEIIETIYIWWDGKRLLPKNLEGGCGYYSIADFNIDFRKVIEENTDYIFYGITDYSEEGKESLKQIYEDEEYKYYLNCENSDKVLIHFTLNNLDMTLEYALNNHYITPEQLEGYNGLLIKEEKE